MKTDPSQYAVMNLASLAPLIALVHFEEYWIDDEVDNLCREMIRLGSGQAENDLGALMHHRRELNTASRGEILNLFGLAEARGVAISSTNAVIARDNLDQLESAI